MLTVSKPMTVAKTSHYLQGDDYYLSERDEWQGSGAHFLGLEGDVRNEEFQALLLGQKPGTGEHLVDVKRDGVGKAARRGGVDLTFSAPKSVSLLALGDPEIKEVHEQAAAAVVEYLEQHHSHVREQRDGSRSVEATGNLAVAKFTHMVPRARDGAVFPDSQLHTHAFLVNLSRTRRGPSSPPTGTPSMGSTFPRSQPGAPPTKMHAKRRGLENGTPIQKPPSGRNAVRSFFTMGWVWRKTSGTASDEGRKELEPPRTGFPPSLG